jgi:LmbE family N-acetylglucosaminyl deacetylase
MMDLEKPRRLFVMSPHLDDAVLSCAYLLKGCPGATVATLLAGIPREHGGPTDWDARCGFGSGGQAMRQRRAEDLRALDVVGAKAVHLDFLDAQYGQSPRPQEIAQTMTELISIHDPDVVMIPLGLFHTDHMLVHEAGWLARACAACRTWLCYEDALYRSKPGLLQRRLAQLFMRGVCLTPAEFDVAEDIGMKRAALDCYLSQGFQLGLTKPRTDALAAERYWLCQEQER